MSKLNALREATKLQERIAESELRCLQEVLGTMKKERDEAVLQVKQLKESLSELWSPTRESTCQVAPPNTKHPFSHSSGLGCLGSSLEYPQQIHMDIFSEVNQSWVDSAPEQLGLADIDMLDEDHEILNMGSLNMVNDQCVYKPHSDVEAHLQRQSSIVSTSSWGTDLQRQSSIVSTASEGKPPTRQSSLVSTAASRFHNYSDSEKPSDNMATYAPRPAVFSNHQSPRMAVKKACVKRGTSPKHVMENPSTPNPKTEKPLMLSFTPPSKTLTLVSSLSSPTVSGISIPSQQSTNKGRSSSNSLLPQKRHLSEPLELDILEDSMITSLPEKGKLLEAVSKAGPLLQELLVIGTLPDWNNPPPMMDIPMVPIASNISSFPLPDIHSNLPLCTLSLPPYLFDSHKLQSNMHMVHS